MPAPAPQQPSPPPFALPIIPSIIPIMPAGGFSPVAAEACPAAGADAAPPPMPPIIFCMPSIISCMPAGGFPVAAEAGAAAEPIAELSPTEASGRAPAGGGFGLAGAAAAG